MPATSYNLFELISAAKPGVREATRKAYFYSLKRAAPVSVQNKLGSGLSENKVRIKWMKDTEKTLMRIRGFSPSVERTTLTALMVVAFYLYGETSKQYERYRERFDVLTTELAAEIAEHDKTPVQEENWVELGTLREIAVAMPKERPRDRRNRLTAFLYTMQPPARNDYGTMELLTDFSKLEPASNYLFIEEGVPKEFIFQTYKTSGKYGSSTVPLTPELREELVEFLDGRTEGYMFGKPLTKAQMGYALRMAFESTGKRVTINLMRHIWASEMVDIEQSKKQEELAKAMMHSQMMQVEYAKK